MEKKLNLLGVKKLNLLKEAIEDKIINYQWVNEQLNKAGFPTKNINGNFQISCNKPLLSIIVTYDNSDNKVINEVEIQTEKQFPLIKQQTIKLSGNQLTTQNLKKTVMQLIPSALTLQEAEELDNIPNQSMNNLNQFYEIKKYFESNFNIKEDIVSDDSGLIWELTSKRYIIRVVLNKGNKPYYEPKFKSKQGTNKFEFNKLEDLFKSLEKNLGINDLTSQLYTTTADDDLNQTNNTEDINNTDNRVFNRNANLNKEEQALRSKLSKEVLDTLNSVNEDYDRKNINIWNLAYSKCKNDKEKDILIQLFMNKKMNIKAEYIERNFVGLRKWVDQKGFDINKNLALKFIDKYSSLYPNEEIPSGSLIILIDLANHKIIDETNPVLINDKQSILYVKDIYNNLNNNYENVIDSIKMYYDVYTLGPTIMTQNKINELKQFKFIPESDMKNTMKLAYIMCIDDNEHLRDINTIETIYSIITDKSRRDIQDNNDDEVDIKKIQRDWRQDKKLDSLPSANKKTLRLIQNSVNDVFNNNPQARKDFENSLNQLTGE